MKLYGGRRPERRKREKKATVAKKKIIISVLLIITALIMTATAVAINHIKPPEIGLTAGNEPSGTGNKDASSDDEISIGDAERKSDFFTMLVVGTDAASMSTDTIILASFDIAANKLNMMSIPRDTIVNTRRTNKKINCAYSAAGGDIFALYDEVESVTGIRPDKYVIVSVDGFVKLIDAVGGITVDVPIDMRYNDPTQNLVIDIDKGVQTLDGYDAMGFMRYRKTYAEGDIGRIKMQHTFISAAVRKLLTPATFVKIPELAEIFSENVETDLSVGNVIWLGKKLLSVNTESDVKTHTLPGYAEYYNHLSYYFPNEAEVLSVINEFYNPYTTPIQKLDLFRK